MKRVPLRRRLFLLVAVGLLPVAVISGIALYFIYEQQREQAERSGLEVARALSTAVDAELRRTISILEVFAASAWRDDTDPRTLVTRARQAHSTQGQWNAVILTDASGQPLFNTALPEAMPISPVIDAPSLQRVLREGKPVVGQLTQWPLGQWGVPIRVPVARDGAVRHVLTAVLDPAAILEVLEATRVPGQWVIAVSDSNGMRVARTHSTQQTIGTPFSPTLVEMMSREGDEGTGTTLNSEGVKVHTAYTRSPQTGWVTAVGLPVSLAEEVTRGSFVTFGSGVALSIALGALAALVIARSINQPMEKLREAALGVGGRGPLRLPETAIREIQDVAHALVASAEERSRGEAEREDLLRGEQAARSAAEAANRSKDEFLAMLGHELRNPLGAISNAAALLEHSGVDEARREAARRIISRQVALLGRLTDDLLDAGRAVVGKIVLQRRPLDLALVVNHALATLAASGRSIDHRIDQDLEPVWVDADGIRIDQVVANLVVNAVKYSPVGSRIRVSVKREGGEAMLRVIDAGIGIPPELAQRVFDLFVQGDRPLDRTSGGLGIGLTLVRRLAELHGGSVHVHSEGEGRGSEFVVRLPAIEPRASAEQPAAVVAARAGRHILVVEDNADARETLHMLLELEGHRVVAEADGESGLATALRERPEVMLVDVGLPRMNGYELARRIRAADGWVQRPFMVAITGYGQAEDQQRAIDAGFDDHLTKPVDPKRLIEVIAAAGATSPSGPSSAARP